MLSEKLYQEDIMKYIVHAALFIFCILYLRNLHYNLCVII